MAPGDIANSERLTALAREAWEASALTQIQAAEKLQVAQATFAQAVNAPARSLSSLRMRIIEAFTPYRVEGPLYQLVERSQP